MNDKQHAHHGDEITMADEDLSLAIEDLTLEGQQVVDSDESVPRRTALGLAGMAGIAGMAGLAAISGANSASAAPKNNRSGQLTRVRTVTDSVTVPNNSNRTLKLVCPKAKNSETVFVMSGGYSHTTNNPAFVVKTNAPDSARSWVVDGHNVNTGSSVGLGGFAICAYFRK